MKRAFTALVVVALLVTTIAGPAAGASTADAAGESPAVEGGDLLLPFDDPQDVGDDSFVGCYPKPELCGP